MSPLAITRDELSVWARYIKEISGIALDESKGYLFETRLRDLVDETRVASFSELFYKVRADVTNRLRRKVVDAMTTNETSFFRDTAPFDLLRHKLIPELIDRRRRNGVLRVPLRIWSAACSTGQEIYSISIILKELLGDLTRYDIRVVGTDISDKAIAKASYGVYTKFEIERGMPQDLLSRHFQAAGDGWKIRDEIRALATFKNVNLLEPLSFPTPFDIIFCRNIAIYFTEADRAKLFRNLIRQLAPDGSLIIGSTESIAGLCPELEPKRHLRAVFYQTKKLS
jgi:chemotaxis protein methyltransferase CheR